MHGSRFYVSLSVMFSFLLSLAAFRLHGLAANSDCVATTALPAKIFAFNSHMRQNASYRSLK